MPTSSFTDIAGAVLKPSTWHVNWRRTASRCSSPCKWIAFPFTTVDRIIPANVARAANFYQPNGLLHGQPEIRAADSTRTRIIGNFRSDYTASPYNCEQYPWYDRVFAKTHTQIECDADVWKRAEALIRSDLMTVTENETEP